MAMQDLNGVVLGVGSMSGTSKAGRPYTKFDVQFSDGKAYVTFKPEIATKASQLQGQPVTVRINVKQDGNFTNYYLEDVAPEGQLAPLTPEQYTPVQIVPQNNTGGGMDNKDTAIRKAVALKAAVDLISGGSAQIDELEVLTDRCERILKGESPVYPGNNQAQTTQELASTVPNTQVGDGNSQQW